MIEQILQQLPPAIILMLGSIFLAVKNKYLRTIIAITLPIVTLLQVWQICLALPTPILQIEFSQFVLLPLHVHPYTLIFATAFCIVTLATAIFSVWQSKPAEIIAGFISAGSAIGICFAGDFITMLLYCEILAISSFVIIFSSQNPRAQQAATRYAIMHFLAGMLLMAGIIGHINLSGSAELVRFNATIEILFPGFALDMNGIITWLILTGLLINVAAPPFSAWLADSYPVASPTGSIFLTAFTTKATIFILITVFAGTKFLVFVGLFMVFYGIIYALLENDMRRVLSYSIINQVGFMVVAVGIGTDLALNGAATHAFCHIIYKALLFMSAASVVIMTGKNRLSEVGGLCRTMKITTICGVIGALAISAFPFTSGFVSKTMIVSEAASEGLYGVWFLLLAASAGVFLHAGIKFPWFVFFAENKKLDVKDPPFNMLIAMILLAVLCILPAIPGLTNTLLYNMLPIAVDYIPYTPQHIVTDLQLLAFSALAFFMLLPLLKRSNTVSLDFDWLYRGLAFYIITAIYKVLQVPLQFIRILFKKLIRKIQQLNKKLFAPGGLISKNYPICTTIGWTIFLLGLYLVITNYYR